MIKTKTTKRKPRIKIVPAHTDKIGECYVIVKGRNGKTLQTTQIFSAGLRSAILNLKSMRDVFREEPLRVQVGDKIITI
jgi:hypothetical protein